MSSIMQKTVVVALFSFTTAASAADFLQRQLSITEGAPQGTGFDRAASGPQGRPAAESTPLSPWLSTQLSLSDGGPQPLVEHSELAGGPAGRRAESMPSADDRFLENQRMLSDGAEF